MDVFNNNKIIYSLFYFVFINVVFQELFVWVAHQYWKGKSWNFLLSSGVDAGSFESWYSWFLSFLPQWFMIPTRISSRFIIQEDFWSPIDLMIFLSGNLVSFCISSSAFNFYFIRTRYHHLFGLGIQFFFCNWTLSTRLLKKQADYQPRLHESYRGSGGMLPGKNFGKLDSLKRHFLDRTQLIYTCILLSFSQSLVIHDSRAEVQRFMIFTCFVSMIHDSASAPNLSHKR